MRTLTQILSDLKASFITSPELADAYALDQTKTFDEQFSKVSLEAILLYTVAYAIALLEKVVDAFSTEVDSRISAAYITSEPWYHNAALAFQQGDALVYNPATYKVDYAAIDATKQIVRFAAVKTVVPTLDTQRSKIQIKVSKAGKVALTTEELDEFRVYMSRKGAAGITYDISSGDPVQVAFSLVILRDPLRLQDTDAGRATINAAISQYLDNLDYGGEISTAGLVRTVLAVPGVRDIRYNHAIIGADTNESVQIESATGAFTLDVPNMEITMS